MNTKRVQTLAVIALVSLMCVFAQGGREAEGSDGLTHIEMWYNPTQTEAGPLPDDWVGYELLRDMGIDLETSSLPSSSTDQDSRIQAAAAAGTLPDFFVASRRVWQDLVDRGLLADVTDCYQKMPQRTALMFDDEAVKFTSVDGRSYGFATPSSITRNEGLIIRKDWLDNLGLGIPVTLDELYNVLYAFTFNDPDGNGKDDTYGFGAFVEQTPSYEIYPGRRFEPLMGAFGVEGTWSFDRNAPGLQIHRKEYYDFMVFLKKCIDTGVIDPAWMSCGKDDFRAAWKEGRFGCFREQNSALHSKSSYAPFDNNFPQGELVVIDPPVGSGGHSSVGPSVRGFRIWCVSASAAANGKLDKICQMFEWMSAGEGYILCGWGQEGVNFVYDDNGIPVSAEGDLGFEEPLGQQYVQLRSMAFNYKSELELVSRYPSYTCEKSGKQISPLTTLRTMQDRKWTPADGMDSMPIASNELLAFYEQSLADFLAGKTALNETSWKSFIDKFDSLGGTEWEKTGVEYAKANNYLH